MNASLSVVDPAARSYAAFLEALSPDRLGELDGLCAPDVHFRDPFNDTRGIPAMAAVLRDMFERVDGPRFTVTGSAIDGSRALLAWTMTFRPKGRTDEWRIEGASFVTFDAEGRVIEHIDHWDAAGQLYARLPVIGTVVRLLRRRLSAGLDNGQEDGNAGCPSASGGRRARQDLA